MLNPMARAPGATQWSPLGPSWWRPVCSETFYGRLRPISDQFVPASLAVSGLIAGRDAGVRRAAPVMDEFARWIAAHGTGRPMFVSDNNGFDWQFINWYFHEFLGKQPLRPLVDEPRLALQRARQGHDEELQAPAPHRSYAQPGRRRPGQRRGAASHARGDGAQVSTPVAAGPLPSICHDCREQAGTSRRCVALRGTSEPADITHDTAQGRATPEVFVSACRPIRIPLGSRFSFLNTAS